MFIVYIFKEPVFFIHSRIRYDIGEKYSILHIQMYLDYVQEGTTRCMEVAKQIL